VRETEPHIKNDKNWRRRHFLMMWRKWMEIELDESWGKFGNLWKILKKPTLTKISWYNILTSLNLNPTLGPYLTSSSSILSHIDSTLFHLNLNFPTKYRKKQNKWNHPHYIYTTYIAMRQEYRTINYFNSTFWSTSHNQMMMMNCGSIMNIL